MDWITDRLPTEADSDIDGDVIFLLDGDSNAWSVGNWRSVEPGQPWLAFAPPANFLNSIAAAVEAGQRRRIISIARTMHDATETIDAVADDGTAWWMVTGKVDWTQLPALPDREVG